MRREEGRSPIRYDQYIHIIIKGIQRVEAATCQLYHSAKSSSDSEQIICNPRNQWKSRQIYGRSLKK